MQQIILKLYALVIPLPVLLAFLLHPVTPAWAGEIDYRPLQEDIQTYLAQQKGTYGVYIIDIDTGATTGINQLAEFHAASTFKIPLTLYIYRAVANGSLDPENSLEFRPKHREGGTGRLQNSPTGTRISIDELARYAIVYSDNVATNMLLDLAGSNMVKDYMAGLGGHVVDHNRNVTCPKDMALFMEEVIRFAGVSPWGEKLLGYLQDTIYTDRIPYSLPDIPVANKIGNWPPTGTYNDVAYVSHPDRPYIISVFSRQTPGYTQAVQVIREISRQAYAYQSNPYYLVEITLDSHYLPLTEKPFVNDQGVTMVPLRAFTDAVPAISVHWDEATQEVILAATYGWNQTSIVELNAVEDELEIIEGRSYIPLRRICQKLSIGLQWDRAAKRVNLFTPQQQETTANDEP